MMQLRSEIAGRLNDVSLARIKNAPKPTKVAEAVAVLKELKGISINLKEIAEVINVAEPGRGVKARGVDYDVRELARYPDLIVTETPNAVFARYVGAKSLYEEQKTR